MSASHFTAPHVSDKPSQRVKPEKPYPAFPLTAHPAGYWCKKIKGKTRYFGKWEDPDGALRAYRDFTAGKPAHTPQRGPSNGFKPAKPYPDFPLFPHAAGVWAKKIRGKSHYFGPWDNPQGALDKYLKEKDALHDGRKPREQTDGLTVKELCNRFLNAKQAARDNGELSPLMWLDYKSACDCVVGEFGKSRLVADLDPDDFAGLRAKLAKRWGFHRLAKTVQCIRSVFKYAYDGGLIEKPIRFGPGFQRPSKKTMRLHRAKQGPKLFTGEEVRRLIDAAPQPLKAMILLGINAALGNQDCVNLKVSTLDLDKGIIDYPRPKTGIPRRCVLWTETVAAIRETVANRPQPKNPDHADLVFITRYGAPWGKNTPDGPISRETSKLLHKLGINGRTGLGFYTLRHTFRTVADEAKDQPAADFIMGHESPHISSVYRETISDERLRAVAKHVRAWLFRPTKKDKPKSKQATAAVDETARPCE
jgi:integrase